MRVGLAIAGLMVLAAPGVVLAQSASVSVDQLGAGDARTATQQISGVSRAVVPAERGDRSAFTESLAATRATSAPQPVSQLTTETPTAQPGAQLNNDGPRADAPVSGTNRAQGRNTTAEALAGHDRCDPRSPDEQIRSCARVIETRSAEFSAPEVNPLTPEQRLLVAQRELTERNRDVGDAVRRLGNGDVDYDNVGIIVASQGMGASAPAEEERPESTEPSATDAIVSAIVNSMGVQQP